MMNICFFNADSSKPLMGVLQEEQGVISLPAHCPSQAIVDVSENMRAKIYALFCKIGECGEMIQCASESYVHF